VIVEILSLLSFVCPKERSKEKGRQKQSLRGFCQANAPYPRENTFTSDELGKNLCKARKSLLRGYAKPPLALCSLLLSFRLIEILVRREQGA
jgi:hypothetical protein